MLVHLYKKFKNVSFYNKNEGLREKEKLNMNQMWWGSSSYNISLIWAGDGSDNDIKTQRATNVFE